MGGSVEKKSARELRQGGSDYRCCIPALAGFVSPQSIAPDGKKLFSKDGLGAISFSRGGDLSQAERSGKRQVRLNSIYIGLINCGRFGHVALAFCALGRKQVSAGRMLSFDFTRPSDFEPLRD